MSETREGSLPPVADQEENRGAVRPRAVLLGLLLALGLCVLEPYNNAYRHATLLGGGHFPLAPFFVLLWLTIVIGIGNRVLKRTIFTGRELLFMWALMVLTSGIAWTGLVRTFFVNLTTPERFATVGNHFEQVLFPLMPDSWYPKDPEAVEMLYNGLSGGYRMGWLEVAGQVPWHAWVVPLLVWGSFVLLCYFVMICIVNLFSRQWITNERMNFPLLRVPQLMEEAFDKGELRGFFTNRFFIAGALLPLFLHTINGLNFYYPSVPQIPTLLYTGTYFPKYGLFSAFYKMKIHIYPAFIGFAFLASRQISFSFWVFFMLGSLFIGALSVLGYNIPAGALGVTFGPTLTRPEECQMIGAYGVFFFFLVWLARAHLLEVARASFTFRRDRCGREWFDTCWSFWGFLIGSALIIAWCTYFGMPLLTSFLFIAVCLMLMLVVSRIVAQGGLPYITLTAAPMDGILAMFGTRFFTSVGLLVGAVVQKVLFVDVRESLMPSLVHTRKVTEGEGNRRLVFSAVVVTLVLGVALSFVAMLVLSYRYGLRELQLDWATQTSITVYDNVRSLVEGSPAPGHWVRVFAVVGAVVMLALVVCYHRVYWWPLHPIGYLTTYSSAMRILWFAFFVGWAANALCMRYGGVAFYRSLRNFFVGLIVADFLMGGIFALIGLFGSGAAYQVFPT
ncbi:MAG: DUF6785 family protein [Desulfatibacillaceae bacterium]